MKRIMNDLKKRYDEDDRQYRGNSRTMTRIMNDLKKRYDEDDSTV
jgi:hypothetical protein